VQYRRALKTRVIVPDVAKADLARSVPRPRTEARIRAGWSQPILTKENQVLGTFAVYLSRVPRADGCDLALIEAAGT